MIVNMSRIDNIRCSLKNHRSEPEAMSGIKLQYINSTEDMNSIVKVMTVLCKNAIKMLLQQATKSIVI